MKYKKLHCIKSLNGLQSFPLSQGKWWVIYPSTHMPIHSTAHNEMKTFWNEKKIFNYLKTSYSQTLDWLQGKSLNFVEGPSQSPALEICGEMEMAHHPVWWSFTGTSSKSDLRTSVKTHPTPKQGDILLIPFVSVCVLSFRSSFRTPVLTSLGD